MNADLDRMMATQVMGWNCESGMTFSQPHGVGETVSLILDWHPSSDIAQAFQCLEKFSRGWFMRKNQVGVFCCVLGGEATADTPAEAICRAIEKALEGK